MKTCKKCVRASGGNDLTVVNAKVFDSGSARFIDGGIKVENGIITALFGEEKSAKDGALDFCGDLLIPGLIDVHTHGREGYDFISASVEELGELKRAYAAKGVTTVVPTLASAAFDTMLDALGRIREAGFRAAHIEGRYLDPDRRGAHDPEYLAPLDPDEIGLFAARAGEGMKLHFSAAFEHDLSGEFLNEIVRRGYTAGLAHTGASYEQASELVKRGLRSFTHLFNAMPKIHHRAGGAVVAGLLSDAYTEIICDGFHLAPETVKLVSKVKDPSKVVLITDSMEGTGCPDGHYSIAGSPVKLKDGRAYTEDGAIAGSTLDLLGGVMDYAAFSGVPIENAIIAATANPADMLGLPGVGRILPGYHADLIRLSEGFEIKEVYISGTKI